LLTLLDEGVFPGVMSGGRFPISADNILILDFSQSESDKLFQLSEELSFSGLSEQEAALEFSDVTNAMMVALVDRAADTADNKDESASIIALDQLALFMLKTGNLFIKALPQGIKDLKPIQYNGKAKKSKLETLYCRFMKAGMNIEDKLSSLLKDSEPTVESPVIEGVAKPAVDRADSILKIQFLFDIKEPKRSSLEQKLVRDLIMNTSKDAIGGGGGLSGIMNSLTGKGSTSSDFSEAAMEEMLKGVGSGDFGDIPDFKNMKPEELSAMSKDALQAVLFFLKISIFFETDSDSI
jgi:hypothetical protein